MVANVNPGFIDPCLISWPSPNGVDSSPVFLIRVAAPRPILTSDLTFEDFLEELIRDGQRHVKFDFKDHPQDHPQAGSYFVT